MNLSLLCSEESYAYFIFNLRLIDNFKILFVMQSEMLFFLVPFLKYLLNIGQLG
jgi:hypothetical protein